MADTTFSISMDGDVAILAVVGSLDAHWSGEFQKQCGEAMTKSKKIVLDLSALEYFGSAALGVMLATQGGGATLAVGGVSAGHKLSTVLPTMGVDKMFKVCATNAEAKAAL